MSLVTRDIEPVRNWVRAGMLATILLSVAAPIRAQDPAQSSPPPQPPQSAAPATDDSPAATDAPAADKPAEPAEPEGDSKNRIFGVIPNYTTVEGSTPVEPITGAQSFKMAALGSFDPMVFPLFGFIAAVGQIQDAEPTWGLGWEGFAKRYGAAVADNTVCSMITTGLLPTLLKQDPRYYQGRTTGFFPRVYYAASRSAVTKSRSGHPQFNLSEIGGTLMVANISNLYYPEDERTRNATLERWATQAMWDTVANEMKEFWPDIRRMLHWNN